MTVKELKEMLEQYPDDMEILTDLFSDYHLVTADEWGVVEAVPQNGGEWYMRSHPTMSEENKRKAKKYLHMEGN